MHASSSDHHWHWQSPIIHINSSSTSFGTARSFHHLALSHVVGPTSPKDSPGNSPGAAAPTLVVLKSSTIIDRCRSEVVQLIGLVDYPSLKKSIWCRRLLSRRPLNTLTDVASTSSWDKLFQRLMTRCEKN